MTQVNLDSLWNVWKDKSKPDTIHLKVLKDITEYFIDIDSDSSFYYADLLQDFAKSNNNIEFLADALSYKAMFFSSIKKHDESILFFENAINHYNNIGNFSISPIFILAQR